jgi:hypothetical protein
MKRNDKYAPDRNLGYNPASRLDSLYFSRNFLDGVSAQFANLVHQTRIKGQDDPRDRIAELLECLTEHSGHLLIFGGQSQ